MPKPEETHDELMGTDAEEMQELDALFNANRDLKRADQPIGTFQVKLTDAFKGNSQSSGRPQITYEMVILAGPHKDIVLKKYDGLTDTTITITMGQLKALGVDIKKLTSRTLPSVLLALKDTILTVKCMQNGDFYNIYFQKKLQKHKPGTNIGKSSTTGGTTPHKRF